MNGVAQLKRILTKQITEAFFMRAYQLSLSHLAVQVTDT